MFPSIAPKIGSQKTKDFNGIFSEFLIKCFDYKFHGRHKLIGSVTTSVAALQAGQRVLELMPPPPKSTAAATKAAMKNGASGKGKLSPVTTDKRKKQKPMSLQMMRFHVRREFTWLEFIAGGYGFSRFSTFWVPKPKTIGTHKL